MLAAIESLNAAVAQEESAHQATKEAAQNGHAQEAGAAPSVDGPRTISLKQRVVPFIDMLRRAHAEDKEVVWGV
jgi:cyclopropane-fatty-acyl-phospholipid synthase